MLNQLEKASFWAAIVAVISFAQAAPADDYQCKFEKICFEGLGCEGGEPLELTVTEAIENKYVITFPGDITLPVMKMTDKMPGPIADTEAYITQLKRNTVHLVTIFFNGEARFSAHSYANGSISNASKGHCVAISPA